MTGAKWTVPLTELSGSMKGPSWEKDIHNDQEEGAAASERQPTDSGGWEEEILQVEAVLRNSVEMNYWLWGQNSSGLSTF